MFDAKPFVDSQHGVECNDSAQQTIKSGVGFELLKRRESQFDFLTVPIFFENDHHFEKSQGGEKQGRPF